MKEPDWTQATRCVFDEIQDARAEPLRLLKGALANVMECEKYIAIEGPQGLALAAAASGLRYVIGRLEDDA